MESAHIDLVAENQSLRGTDAVSDSWPVLKECPVEQTRPVVKQMKPEAAMTNQPVVEGSSHPHLLLDRFPEHFDRPKVVMAQKAGNPGQSKHLEYCSERLGILLDALLAKSLPQVLLPVRYSDSYGWALHLRAQRTDRPLPGA
jgi:hypothetical protein